MITTEVLKTNDSYIVVMNSYPIKLIYLTLDFKVIKAYDVINEKAMNKALVAARKVEISEREKNECLKTVMHTINVSNVLRQIQLDRE